VSLPVRLVPVEVEANDGDPVGQSGADVAWELLAPSGHVLRVYERGAMEVLREALTVVAGGRHKP
jgi:hypothetical protein